MFSRFVSLSKFSLFVFSLSFLFVAADFCDYADARSRSGGRSFSRTTRPAPTKQSTLNTTRTSPTRSSSFMRSMGGAIAGGFIGSMLFSGLAHAGMGGFGGSGIGLIEILLIGGLIYFLVRRFSRRGQTASYGAGGFSQGDSYGHSWPGSAASPSLDPVADGLKMIADRDPEFDPEWFKEVAQDVFFKIQAGWMRRDLSTFGHLLGTQLLAEYAKHFAEMQEKGELNRLENIAVRSIDIVDAGIDQDEEFVTLLFTANLLDYTVDEASGNVISGDPTEPVKFKEQWTFARRIGEKDWKLEGIKE